jgi:hypothetical protein
MNGERPSGTFRTMAGKVVDSPLKRASLIASGVVAIVIAIKTMTPAVAPLVGLVTESDLKWRTEKIIKLEQDVAAKESRIAILELQVNNLEKDIERLERER